MGYRVKEGLKPVVTGMALGLLIAIFIARAIASLLFGVAPLDVRSLGAGLFVLLASAFIACWIPTSAATRIDPMNSIRYE